MWYNIRINLDNAAFCDEPDDELMRILDNVVYRIQNEGHEGTMKLFDINGNEVGEAKVVED